MIFYWIHLKSCCRWVSYLYTIRPFQAPEFDKMWIPKLLHLRPAVTFSVGGVSAGEVPASNGIFHCLPIFGRVSVPNGIDQILWHWKHLIEAWTAFNSWKGLQDVIKYRHSTLEKDNKWRNSSCTQSFARIMHVNHLWLLPFEQEQASHVMG